MKELKDIGKVRNTELESIEKVEALKQESIEPVEKKEEPEMETVEKIEKTELVGNIEKTETIEKTEKLVKTGNEEKIETIEKIKTTEKKTAMLNLTEGDPLTLILRFAFPMLLGTLFQQFYGMMDTIIVGKMIGLKALAGVGSTGAINFMINGFVIGTCSGFAIPVAQKFGAGQFEKLRKYVGNILYLTVIFSIVMTVVIGVLTKPILQWMNTPEETFSYAYLYIFIVFLGIPTTFLYNITSSVVRSLGDSKTPVYFLILAALLNIILDYVSIRFLGFGVDGPAYATVISQFVSGLLCLIYMIKRFPIIHLKKEDLKLERHYYKRLLLMGVPMGLQYSITAIGSVILQTAVNGLGSQAMAAITAGQRISNFCCCVFDSLGVTMATFAGQNVGARKLSRIKKGVWEATKVGSIYAVLICAVLFFFGDEIPKIFINANEVQVIKMAKEFLLGNAFFYIPLAVLNVWRFSVQGMGFSGFAMLAGVSEMIARIIVAFIFIPLLGYMAACYASPLAWIFADAFLIPAFFKCMKRLKRFPA